MIYTDSDLFFSCVPDMGKREEEEEMRAKNSLFWNEIWHTCGTTYAWWCSQSFLFLQDW